MDLVDAFNRPLTDLRISVTDRCNFRCRYCMPREHFGPDHPFLERSALLSYEEITNVVQAMLPLGLRKIRITGGEPLLRRGLTRLVSMIRSIDPALDLALTTNGALLGEHAQQLKEAGLNRVTVSLDAIDSALFARMADTKHTTPEDVLEGIQVARQAGLSVKVNAVIQKSVNEREIEPLAEACHRLGVPLRFIEFMDVGNTNSWNLEDVVTGAEIRSVLEQRFGKLQPIESQFKSDVARVYEAPAGHRFGFIESVSNPFCGDCTRARLSANGSLYTCLFASTGHDLKSMLRMDATNDEVRQAVRSIWTKRNDRYSQDRATSEIHDKVEMSFIGG